MLIRLNDNQYFNSDHVVKITKFKDDTLIEFVRGNDIIVTNATPKQIVDLINSHARSPDENISETN